MFNNLYEMGLLYADLAFFHKQLPIAVIPLPVPNHVCNELYPTPVDNW